MLQPKPNTKNPGISTGVCYPYKEKTLALNGSLRKCGVRPKSCHNSRSSSGCRRESSLHSRSVHRQHKCLRVRNTPRCRQAASHFGSRHSLRSNPHPNCAEDSHHNVHIRSSRIQSNRSHSSETCRRTHTDFQQTEKHNPPPKNRQNHSVPYRCPMRSEPV